MADAHHLPQGRRRAGDRHLKFYETRDNLGVHRMSRQTQTPMRKVAAASLIGTTIEFYDFLIYGTAAALIFGPLFFPSLGAGAATVPTFQPVT